MTFSELKQSARKQVKGNCVIMFLCGLVAALLSGFAAIAGGIGAIIVGGPFCYGIVQNHKSMSEGERPTLQRVFSGFYDCDKNSFFNLFLVSLYTFFWSLLFLFPGIVKALAYSMSMFIQADNPKMTAKECITESRRIMDGKKMRYFLLLFSFIGWILLGIITFGIAFIWVIPYIQQSCYNFYLSIKNN